MPAAVIGGAIAGVGAVGAAAIGSKSASNAAKAQQAAADTASATQREIYGSNKEMLAPWVNQGQQATGQINALLGIGDQNYQDFLPQRNAMFDYSAYDPATGQFGYQQPTYTPEEIAAAKQQAMQASQQRATDAFNTYKNSTGYNWRFNEGMRSLNNGLASAGMLKSGSAMKSALNYGQGIASAEFGNYLNALGNQQGVGVTAGSALAGVGQNYANSLGNIAMDNGQAQANAAIAKGAITSNALGQLSTIGAGLFNTSSPKINPAALWNPSQGISTMATSNNIFGGY